MINAYEKALIEEMAQALAEGLDELSEADLVHQISESCAELRTIPGPKGGPNLGAIAYRVALSRERARRAR